MRRPARRLLERRPTASRRCRAHDAFVLHSYDWSEIEPDRRAVHPRRWRAWSRRPKGVKRPTSQLRALLMPFQPVQVQFARPQADDRGAEVRTLRGAEWGGGEVAVLRGSGWFAGFYLNEAAAARCWRATIRTRGVFDAYAATLQSLAGDNEMRTRGGPARLRAAVACGETGVLPSNSAAPRRPRCR